ncbi:MAG: DUF1080 domain-containing protein [Planctomycetota bacterium]|nr:MAG: DUF1080 domain-containing protein [Planctomycetota bacterium]
MVCCVVLVCVAGSALAQDSAFKSLFNGRDLEGWVQAGGEAKYRVEDGTIVGESVPDTPNSFLCTQRIYGDFVLEYEFLCDSMLNSGVQFRSNVYAIETIADFNGKSRTIPAGRVHGYQVEIDPNKPERMWSGGVYDEARRGWLYPGLAGGDPDAFTEQGQKIYRDGEWNTVRIECRGDHIRTWLNGEPRADFHDSMTPKGIIALQVHGIGKNKAAVGKTVRWRNIRIQVLDRQ